MGGDRCEAGVQLIIQTGQGGVVFPGETCDLTYLVHSVGNGFLTGCEQLTQFDLVELGTGIEPPEGEKQL